MHTIPISTKFRLEALQSSLFDKMGVKVDMARLDEIHPVVSGNKLFKLYPYIQQLPQTCNTVVTMGGPYSNHLVATAYYCRMKNTQAIGLVRGEAPKLMSHTLSDCKSLGMQLLFIDRKTYSNINQNNYKSIQHIPKQEVAFIPEGGFGISGCEGASAIMKQLEAFQPNHVVTAVGTATTLAGLIKSSTEKIQIVGIPALIGLLDISERLRQLLPDMQNPAPVIFNDYHFGGYAKYQPELIDFINHFYHHHKIPLDFVYTGKMMFGVIDQIKKGFFPKGSHIVALHTGGLQGNLSLPNNMLDF